MDQNNGWVYKNLGLLNLRSGENDIAEKALLRSVELDSTLVESYILLSELYDKQNRTQDKNMMDQLKLTYQPK